MGPKQTRTPGMDGARALGQWDARTGMCWFQILLEGVSRRFCCLLKRHSRRKVYRHCCSSMLYLELLQTFCHHEASKNL